MKLKSKRAVAAAVALLLLLGSAACVLKYARDQRWVTQRAAAIAGRIPGRESQIRALQQYIRNNITYVDLSNEPRPFLRASARETLEEGKGWCGEATRAYIALSRGLGIPAKRVNLHGQYPHVVPEVELTPGRWVLVEIQNSPTSNPVLDGTWKTTDDVIVSGAYQDHSNLNLRRLPLVNRVVRRVRLDYSWVTWLVENPALMESFILAASGIGILLALLVDRILLLHYGKRLRGHWVESVAESSIAST